MALAVLVALGFSATTAFAAAPAQTHTITVEAGQTLSEIAASQLPALSLGDAIVEIQMANGLSTDQVHAGQTLAIPAG
jgi:LysM repeat protein